MCGIFGVIAKPDSDYDAQELAGTLKALAMLSESRGKESAGFSCWNHRAREIQVLRGPVSASQMLRSDKFTEFLADALPVYGHALPETGVDHPFAVFGHARLVTNGTQLDDRNNQPVIKNGIVGVHNGIIVNVDELWQSHPELQREYEVDSEILLTLFRYHLEKSGSLKAASSQTFKELFGTVATAMVFQDLNKAVIATNNGSLYVLTNQRDILLFASERHILERFISETRLRKKIGDFTLRQVQTNSAYVIDLLNFNVESFEISMNGVHYEPEKNLKNGQFKIRLSSLLDKGTLEKQRDALVDVADINLQPESARERRLLEYNLEAISQQRRCSKCLLPETFPFIEFDAQGVCNLCNNYVPKSGSVSLDELHALVEPYRRPDGEPECIVPFSGGRDSTYALHALRRELGMNVLAYTYDWGMVTDLARRNIARTCGTLGVENIIVSADIRRKRRNIRLNIEAWLRRPTLGIVPLFMAGDKSFFYYMTKLKQQTKIDLNIWGINYLENTDFKVGFCGAKLDFDKKNIYALSAMNQMRLYGYLARTISVNPRYLNFSIYDSVKSFLSRQYFKKADYFNFYDYTRWDEAHINRTILDEYDWEMAIDTKSLWRIGDGTAPFYNYIYYTVAGFSEYDTFRSNQIREGMLDREQALATVNEENRPRYESLKWYTEIVGLDFERTVKIINSIPKLYQR